MRKRLSQLAAFACCVCTPMCLLADSAPQSKETTVKALAFPGAEGGGAYTVGGRGGKVFLVTNLDDDGPGSFRDAVEAEGPRTVMFQVGGLITLTKPLR